MSAQQKYEAALENLPPSGGGGCHTALLGVANLGVHAGLADEQILDDLREHVYGGRVVSDSEILEAIAKARGDRSRGPFTPMPKPTALTTPHYLERLLNRGAGTTLADLMNTSPVPIPADPAAQAWLLLNNLYRDDDVIFIGTRYDKNVYRVADLRQAPNSAGIVKVPHIIPNPLSGNLAPTKSGKLSLRCDAAVADYRFAVVEFDNIPKEDQLAFWAAAPLPVVALIDSGKKSIHGWIRISGVKTADQWNDAVRIGLYEQRLAPLGVDRSCANPSRLSRLAGHQRDGGGLQQLIYLNPNPTPEGIQ